MRTNVAHFVGLDYHEETIQVCILDAEGGMVANRSIPNDAEALDRMVRRHGGEWKAAIETCCGAACLADELQHRYGWHIRQAHAGYVSRIKQTSDKTDFSDARVLADLTRVDYLPEVWIPHEYIRNLRSFVRRRDQLVKQRTAEKLRIRALLRNNRLQPEGSPWSKAWIDWLRHSDAVSDAVRFLVEDHLEMIELLTGKIATMMDAIRELTKNDPLIEILRGQPGVGEVTAVVMRSEIADFTRFRNGKQLANFCGVSPRNVSSGKRQATSGLILSGSPLLRMVLIETAHRIARYDRYWRQLYNRLHEQKHKPKSVAAAAVANRWIRKLYYQVNHALKNAA